MSVSAGDLEKYAYCPLSWWLSKAHKTTAQEGVDYHEHIEQELKDISEKENLLRQNEKYILFFSIAASIISLAGLTMLFDIEQGFWQIFFVIIALLWLLNSSYFFFRLLKTTSILKKKYEKLLITSAIGAIIISLFAVLVTLPSNNSFGIFTAILALIWIALANIIFYRNLALSEEVIIKKLQYSPISGTIEYIGASSEGDTLRSEKYDLSGKPDYILKMDTYYVPVEQKTSNITKPAFSHVIQVTAYCMIVEDLKGMYPPYGILKYKKHEFKIPYEKRWKNLVLKLRDDLASDRQRNEAHRNHNKAYKCKYCVRREFCPEKLV